MQFSSLGDRMKYYEKLTLQERFIPNLPVVCRLDGVSFHNFTKKLTRPYDERLSKVMQLTTQALVKKTNAVIGYTQSDEISLILFEEDYKSQIYFDGKIQKILSVLAAQCTHYFRQRQSILPESHHTKEAIFDCRAFTVPSKWEACNYLIWRQEDAVRNSIQMAGQGLFSHKELQGKSCGQIQEMLFKKGINWNNYPPFFKRGTFIKNQKKNKTVFPGKCTDFVSIDYPRLNQIKNLDEVIFSDKKIILKGNNNVS